MTTATANVIRSGHGILPRHPLTLLKRSARRTSQGAGSLLSRPYLHSLFDWDPKDLAVARSSRGRRLLDVVDDPVDEIRRHYGLEFRHSNFTELDGGVRLARLLTNAFDE